MDNLSKMAKLAREKGVSYGKFMAIRYEKEQKLRTPFQYTYDKEKEQSGYKKCILCGNYYYPNCAAQKFCTSRCRMNARMNTKVMIGELT